MKIYFPVTVYIWMFLWKTFLNPLGKKRVASSRQVLFSFCMSFLPIFIKKTHSNQENLFSQEAEEGEKGEGKEEKGK